MNGTLPTTPRREGDDCPNCGRDTLMDSVDGQPFVMCDNCGTEYEHVAGESIEVRIYSTSNGFVSPSALAIGIVSSAFDGHVERKIAKIAQASKLAAGLYVAKWTTHKGTLSEYVFSVTIETDTTHRVEVTP